MARIKPQGTRSAPPSRNLVLPGWVPLVVVLLGLGVVLDPTDSVSWTLRVLGAALLAGGAFWLGQDRQHDPHDRSRISDLERQLMRLGILDRELGARADVAAALGGGGQRPPAPGPRPGPPAQPFRVQPRPPRRPPRPASFDDPLPGEER